MKKKIYKLNFPEKKNISIEISQRKKESRVSRRLCVEYKTEIENRLFCSHQSVGVPWGTFGLQSAE